MHIQELHIPEKVEWNRETLTSTYGQFTYQPFERTTARLIGNALRRSLLSSLKGAAVTRLKIEGVLHEYSTIPGVLEDVAQLILHVKKLAIKMNSETPRKMSLHVVNPLTDMREITAGDIQTDADVEVLNKDLHLAYLDKHGRLDMEMDIEVGRGFLLSDLHKIDMSRTDYYYKEELPIGVLVIDSDFNPVHKVAFEVIPTGGEDLSKLVMDVWTNGSIAPQDAVAHAAKIFKDQLSVFTNFREEFEDTEPRVDEEEEKRNEYLSMSVEELELSVRSNNCLKNANIRTVSELVQKTEMDLLKTRNFGKKSLNEIKGLLSDMNLSLGMKLDEAPAEKPRGRRKKAAAAA